MHEEALTCSATDFAELRDDWNDLVARSRSGNIFLTYEWLNAWWRHLRRAGDRPLILAVSDGAGATLGIAPLFQSRFRVAGSFPLRCIRFIGDGSEDSDYLDFVASGPEEASVLRAILQYLHAREKEWDVLLLRGIPAGSPTLEIFPTLAAELGLVSIVEEMPCGSIPLASDWDAYLRTLQARFRSKLKSALRFLDTSGDTRVEKCEDAAELDEYLSSLFSLHQKRWQGVGHAGAFSPPERRKFYADFARAFLCRGWLGLYRLRLRGTTVAVQIGFEYGNRFFQLQEGFEPEQGSLSVGIMLRAFVLRDLIARQVDAYDFLGGFNAYKSRWGAQPKQSFELLVSRPSIKNKAVLALPRMLAGAKETVRRICPEPILQMRRRLILRNER